MDLDSVADELYALPAEEFTAARTAQEKAAKTAGDKDLAAAIRALGKPNQVAWVVNQLARQDSAEVQGLVDVGRQLRSTPGGAGADQLREVARRERDVVRTLVANARGLVGAGRTLSPAVVRGLEETFHAAVVDPDSAEQVLAGRLTTALQHYGFTVAPSGRAAPALTLVPGGSDDAAEEPSADASSAEAAAAAAAEAREQAARERDEARLALAKADDKVDRLRAKLDLAVTESKRARREYEKRSVLLDKLTKAAKDAQAAVKRRPRR